jgi:hypothetical protein
VTCRCASSCKAGWRRRECRREGPGAREWPALVAVLHRSAGGRTEPAPSLCSSDADGLRPSKLKHAVQGMNCDGDLRRATPVRSRAQRISNHSFEATDN